MLLEAVDGDRDSYEKTVKKYCGEVGKPLRTYVIVNCQDKRYKKYRGWSVGEGKATCLAALAILSASFSRC